MPTHGSLTKAGKVRGQTPKIQGKIVPYRGYVTKIIIVSGLKREGLLVRGNLREGLDVRVLRRIIL